MLNSIATSVMQAAGVPVLDTLGLSSTRIDTMCDGTHFACKTQLDTAGDGATDFAGLTFGDHMEGPVIFTQVQLILNAVSQTAPVKVESAPLLLVTGT